MAALKLGAALLFGMFLCSCDVLARQSFGIADTASFLESETSLDLYCLRVSYPQICDLAKDGNGGEWLVLADGRRVIYASTHTEAAGLAVDVRQSLAQSYQLEPERPEMPAGYAPGRRRSYDLLEAIYGRDEAAVQRNLKVVPFLNKKLRLSPQAAEAFANVLKELGPLAASRREWLLPEGAFYWRRIAGENVMSAHSYGIAIDLGVKKAPYWRWSRTMPHPLQKNYPGDIVSAFERHGFIWGGKWREYDLMHFEYRPEIICKARIRKARQGIK